MVVCLCKMVITITITIYLPYSILALACMTCQRNQSSNLLTTLEYTGWNLFIPFHSILSSDGEVTPPLLPGSGFQIKHQMRRGRSHVVYGI